MFPPPVLPTGKIRFVVHNTLIIIGKISRNINTLRARHTITALGTGYRYKFLVLDAYPVIERKFLRGLQINTGTVGNGDILFHLFHSAHSAENYRDLRLVPQPL